MGRRKGEKLIGKAKLIFGGAYNGVGDVVNVYLVDSQDRIYYYDDCDRWCYVNPGEYEWVKKPKMEEPPHGRAAAS